MGETGSDKMTWGKNAKKLGKSSRNTTPPLEVISFRQNRMQKGGRSTEQEPGSPGLRSFSTSASSTGSNSFRQYPREVDAKGNIEYKLRLVNIPQERLEHLKTQMKWRVEEGRGEAIYRIGVMDNGEAVGISTAELTESIKTVERVAKSLNFEAIVTETYEGMLHDRQCATVTVRRQDGASTAVTTASRDVRVAIIGPSESGKSSLAGYLTQGVTDDGMGKAGRCVAVHKHEIRHGRTSSFSTHALPRPTTDASRPVVMKGVENIFSDMDLEFDAEENAMVDVHHTISLLDTGGHVKALSSCIRGLAACVPDYVMLCIDSATACGASPERLATAHEFLRVVQQAGLPYLVVVSKTDLTEFEGLENGSVLAQFGDHPIDVDVDTVDSVLDNLAQVVPIVRVSCVTGSGMDALQKLLRALRPRREAMADSSVEEDANDNVSKPSAVMGIIRHFMLSTDEIKNDETEFAVAAADEECEESLFGGRDDSSSPPQLPSSPGSVEDKKLIIVGIVQAGMVAVGQSLFVGPDRETGAFTRAKIVSMRCASGNSVSSASAGATISVHLQFTDCDDGSAFAKRGAMICDRPSDVESRLLRTFDVELCGMEAMENPLRRNEEVVAFVGAVNQACRVINIDAKVTLQFVYRAEYLLRDVVFIKRGATVLVGKLLNAEG